MGRAFTAALPAVVLGLLLRDGSASSRGSGGKSLVSLHDTYPVSGEDALEGSPSGSAAPSTDGGPVTDGPRERFHRVPGEDTGYPSAS